MNDLCKYARRTDGSRNRHPALESNYGLLEDRLAATNSHTGSPRFHEQCDSTQGYHGAVYDGEDSFAHGELQVIAAEEILQEQASVAIDGSSCEKCLSDMQYGLDRDRSNTTTWDTLSSLFIVRTSSRAMEPKLRQSQTTCYSRNGQSIALSINRGTITSLIYSTWLFTLSDLKTIVIPNTLFGLTNALAIRAFSPTEPSPPWRTIALRIPLVAAWCWLNLLPFAIDNQRHPAAILEDAANKPWRPLPSGRLSVGAAERLMLCMYWVAVGVSFALGVPKPCVALIVVGFGYNHLGGADMSFVVRNAINGAGYVCYTLGAMQVALGREIPKSEVLLTWLVVIGAVITTTVHCQDMYDVVGDRLRGRRTAPLVLGDRAARWTIGIGVVSWSWICPVYWNVGKGSWIVKGLGMVVAYRTLMLRSIPADKTTFRVWNCWIVAVYMLPIMSLL